MDEIEIVEPKTTSKKQNGMRKVDPGATSAHQVVSFDSVMIL